MENNADEYQGIPAEVVDPKPQSLESTKLYYSSNLILFSLQLRCYIHPVTSALA